MSFFERYAHLLMPAGLAVATAAAGIDIALPERQLEDAIRDAIADRGGYLDWWHFDIAGWCALLMLPDREEFRGTTLSTALGWCLVWMMTRNDEIGIGILAV